jgi:hypothetical protein
MGMWLSCRAMRIYSILLLLFPLLTGGCSLLIEGSGYALQQLETKEEVRSSFGKPLKSGIVNDGVEQPDTYPVGQRNDLIGMEYDEFVTHRKIAQGDRGGYGFGFMMTFGLIEFIGFPMSVYDVSSSMLFGYRLRFVYDSQGKVKRIFQNGECYQGPRWYEKALPERKEAIPGIR